MSEQPVGRAPGGAIDPQFQLKSKIGRKEHKSGGRVGFYRGWLPHHECLVDAEPILKHVIPSKRKHLLRPQSKLDQNSNDQTITSDHD